MKFGNLAQRWIWLLVLLLVGSFGIWHIVNWDEKSAIGKPVVGYVESGLTGFAVRLISYEKLISNIDERFELKGFPSPKGLNIALQSGAIDIAIGTNSNFVTRARQNGVLLKYVFPALSNTARVMVKKSSPIKSIDQLKGERVGWVGLPTGTGLGFVLVADKYNLVVNPTIQSADVRPIDFAPPLLIAQLEKGDLEAIVTFEPFVSRLKASGEYRAITKSLTMEWKDKSNSKADLELAGIATSEKILNSNKVDVEDVVAAWKMAAEKIKKDTKRYLTLEGVGDLLWQGADPTTLDLLVKELPQYYLADPRGIKKSIDEARDTLKDLNVYFESKEGFGEAIEIIE